MATEQEYQAAHQNLRTNINVHVNNLRDMVAGLQKQIASGGTVAGYPGMPVHAGHLAALMAEVDKLAESVAASADPAAPAAASHKAADRSAEKAAADQAAKK